MKKFVLLLLILTLIGSVQESNAYTVYTSFSQFCADCAPETVLTENFNSSTQLLPGLSIVSEYAQAQATPSNYIVMTGNILFDQVNSSAKTTFTYADGLYGFGGWFNLAELPLANGPGSGIDVFVDSNPISIGHIDSSYNSQFWGFTSSNLFHNVIFKGALETYYAVDVAVCVTNPVPIPAAVWLLGTGLVGLVGIRRKFK